MTDEPIDADSIRALTREVLRFRDARGWKQFHNPKDMAISLALEAAELLELVQWKNGAELEAHLAERREALEHELSDVLYWLLLISNDAGVDLGAAFLAKMRHNETKYPVERARNTSRKYTDLGEESDE
jgi:NTP pyrophosphatase (non-canonical NTP hydrolase)